LNPDPNFLTPDIFFRFLTAPQIVAIYSEANGASEVRSARFFPFIVLRD
jgi:hypothetical protein